MATPQEVYDAILAYSKQQATWDAVRRVATGVVYKRVVPHPLDGVRMSIETWNDVRMTARAFSDVTEEQLAEVLSLGSFES